jgi:hypothetical protein
MEFIKNNYFELFLSIVLVHAAVVRILYTDLFLEEMNDIGYPLFVGYLIIFAELVSPFILFEYFGPKIKNFGLVLYIVACVGISCMYLKDYSFTDMNKIGVFTNSMENIFLHLEVVIIMIYMIIRKS